MPTLHPGGYDSRWRLRATRRPERSRRKPYATNSPLWIEVTHVTVASKPVARFDGTTDACMDREVPVWTTESIMIDAGRLCTNRGPRQSPVLTAERLTLTCYYTALVTPALL